MLLISLCLFGACGCNGEEPKETPTEANNSYEQITPQQAKEIMDNETGYIIADENCNTNIDGIFAAGDCIQKDLRQLFLLLPCVF